ncbi:MAG: AAA-like domain-containing protein [Theionarchaea archaeon]|nr:AAA-like domain-containing protein [Theionarchaea archaeon]
MKSPFVVGRPITNSEDFFDRESELEEIFSGIKNQYNISLIGERKIGKTSLLNMVCNPDKMKDYGIDSRKTRIISIDSSTVEKGNPASLWRCLLSLFCEEIEDNNIRKELKNKIATHTAEFSDVLKTLSHVQKDVVLIFDEFEAVCEEMDIDFFQNLRYLAQTFRLTYIVSTSRDLLTLTTENKKIVSSPFFNIFYPHFLGLFQIDKARGFIKTRFEGMNIGEEQVDSVLRICGPHPFFLQLFCSLLFGLLPDGGLNLSTRESIKRFEEGIEKAKMKFSVSCNNHFEYFWERFEPKERKALSDITLKGKTDHNLESVLKNLERRGFLITHNGKYRAFSETFQKWILEHMETREEKFPFMIIMAILTLFVSLILLISIRVSRVLDMLPYIFTLVFIVGLLYLWRRGPE